MEILYQYLASGIADSGIRQFGGNECFNEIPPLYHWILSLTTGLLSIYFVWFWREEMANSKQKKTKLNPTIIERICFWLGLTSLLLTFYFKLITKRGFFILNPCHVALLFMLILLAAEDNTNVYMRRLHNAWTGWLFGAAAAFVFPHLEQINTFQFVLYYVQHLILLPIGPLVLYRRYGFQKPAFKNHIPSYVTFLILQTLILVPIGRFLKVNLNFAICHSPSEPFFPLFGYHYFLCEIFHLCLLSYIVRMSTYLYLQVCLWFRKEIFVCDFWKSE